MTAAVPLEDSPAVTASEGSDSTSNPKPSSPCSVVPIADDYDGWSCFRDDEVMQQQSAIKAEEAAKIPYVGDKEPLSSLAAEFQSGSPILQEKIKLIGEQYVALRRTRGDGNCFFRSFMFSYLEHILETQDKAEVERITVNIDQCKKTLQGLGYADFTFEDFFSIFIEQLESVLQGTENSISHEELLQRSRDQNVSDYVVMFFRFVSSGEIRRRSDFFEPFIAGLTNSSVDQATNLRLSRVPSHRPELGAGVLSEEFLPLGEECWCTTGGVFIARRGSHFKIWTGTGHLSSRAVFLHDYVTPG